MTTFLVWFILENAVLKSPVLIFKWVIWPSLKYAWAKISENRDYSDSRHVSYKDETKENVKFTIKDASDDLESYLVVDERGVVTKYSSQMENNIYIDAEAVSL